jgi:predicted NBD/HSP70 family sugar kinase
MVDKVDQDTMHDMNRKLVLQALFNSNKTSRSDIADKIKLHKSTITSIYREVEADDFIEELGEGEVSKVGGRKPKLIRFNRNYGYIVSFDLGRHHLRYVVARMTGEIMTQGQLTIVEIPYAELKRAILQYVLQLGDLGTLNGLVGVTIAIHGVVKANKVSYVPFHKELPDHDLAAELGGALDVPVLLENEANLAAIYVRDFHDYQSDKHLQNFTVINIHNGIGAGLIQNGDLFRGENGDAGEVGRMVMFSKKGTVHLEDLYSEDAILARITEQKGQAEVTRDELLTMYRNHDAQAQTLLKEWADAIARTSFNLAQYSAVEAIFLHSRFMAEEPSLFNLVEKTFSSLIPKPSSEIFFANKSVNKATMAGGVSLMTRHLLGLDDYHLEFALEKESDEAWA